MLYHALVVISDLIVGDSLKVLDDEFVKSLHLSHALGLWEQTLVYVGAITCVAFSAKLLCDLPQEGGVGRGVDVRAETGASWVEPTGALGLESDGSRRYLVLAGVKGRGAAEVGALLVGDHGRRHAQRVVREPAPARQRVVGGLKIID